MKNVYMMFFDDFTSFCLQDVATLWLGGVQILTSQRDSWYLNVSPKNPPGPGVSI